MTARATLSTVSSLVSRRADFDCNGTLTGATVSRTPASLMSSGKIYLDSDGIANLSRHNNVGARVSYVVWSYQTPVAWVYDNGNTYVTNHRYSVTTSKHVNKIRASL